MMATDLHIVGVYLAAGSSKRMGCNKLALPLGNSILGAHALHTALQTTISHIIVVTSENASIDWGAYAREKLTVVICKESKQGMSSSIKTGIREVQKMNADAAMLLLADQPFIQVSMLAELIAMFSKGEADYVAACYQNIIRPPLLMGKTIFPVAEELSGDKGIKHLLLKRPYIKGRIMPFEDKSLFIDIDTREEYREINHKLR
ncbi:NTP transferase domain-containing protein [Robertmurraya sp. DFI.2.37]|uniref:NTP transferase domain-containing protein n=1 Tax=Robertmurraya sp. DFI.2.37 TaxID=3031819 RepID=UPI001246EC68|nr:NTP transferase domain-containing protein [Robertmurraya sp. DFI.2.37]MDF1508877.1 NTP transferase domain-containing protein [Robertmurraya sp. DFI.2.37]